MGRVPRIHIEGGLYFVTTRGGYSQQLFRDDADRQQYLDLLFKYKQEYGFKLFSYLLAPSFIYLLIEIAPGTNISGIMHALNPTYTKYFNSRYDRRGHLFRGRFSSTVIEKDSYLVELTRYIHLAPVQAGIVSKPEDYPWSSYSDFLNKGKGLRKAGREKKEVLGRFSGNRPEQIESYQNFIELAAQDELKNLKRQLQASRILGSQAYIEEVKNKLKQQTQKEKKEKKRAWLKSRPHKIFLAAGGVTILILAMFSIYLYRANLGLANIFKTKLAKKEAEFIKKMSSEKKKLRQDLDEKYRADKVSYQAMQKRLKQEKKKAEKMEEKVEELQKKKIKE